MSSAIVSYATSCARTPRKRPRLGDRLSALRAPTANHVAIDVATPAIGAHTQRVVLAVLRSEKIRGALISVTFVSRRAIAALNRKHLGHAGPTDVISFAFDRPTKRDPIVGDIYISPDVASRNARERRVTVREELTRLAVHGTLHVLGYDHPEDSGRERSEMWKR